MPDNTSKQKPRLKARPPVAKPDALADLPQEKLVAFVARLEAEKEAREQRLIDDGKAVRVICHRFEDETLEEAKARATTQHGPFPDGVTPIFHHVIISYPGGPLPWSPMSSGAGGRDIASPERDAPEWKYDDPNYLSLPATNGPRPHLVRIEIDGQVHEAWFYLTPDNIVQLCDQYGKPEIDARLRHRISASTDDPDKIAKILLHRKIVPPVKGFARNLRYINPGLA